MLAAGGDPDPPRWARIVWAGLGGLIAAALLTAGGGGLGAIQTAAIVIALPFSVVLVLIAVATARALHREHHAVLRRRSADRLSEVTEQISDRVAAQVSAALDDAELPSASNGRRRMSWLRRGP
jgi:choline/glycine/proline betaine transport protein